MIATYSLWVTVRLRHVFVFIISLFACLSAAGEEARIAVASNFKPVMEELKSAFEANTDDELTLVSGSTGKLYTQIRMGAPFDVFLSADQAHIDRLTAEDLAVPDARFTYAIGQLTLWSPSRDVSAETLKDPKVKRIAIANPALAPYGAAAEDLIASLGATAAVSNKLVLGENIGQAFAFVYTRNAETGLVAVSQVLSLPENARGYSWDPPADSYRAVRQDAVLLKRGEGNPAAMAFMTFLQSPSARATIKSYGYRFE